MKAEAVASCTNAYDTKGHMEFLTSREEVKTPTHLARLAPISCLRSLRFGLECLLRRLPRFASGLSRRRKNKNKGRKKKERKKGAGRCKPDCSQYRGVKRVTRDEERRANDEP